MGRKTKGEVEKKRKKKNEGEEGFLYFDAVLVIC